MTEQFGALPHLKTPRAADVNAGSDFNLQPQAAHSWE